MPIFLDRHNVGEAPPSPEDVARQHVKDLEVQSVDFREELTRVFH